MTSSEQPPEAGIADAVGALSDNTAALVRREVDAALREMRERLTDAAVPVAALVAAGGAGIFALASGHRLLLRLLEKQLGPASASLVALLLYGGGAAGLAVLGVTGLRAAPAPFPEHTLRHTAATAKATGEAAADRLR